MKNDTLDNIKKDMVLNAYAYNKYLKPEPHGRSYLKGKNLFQFVHPLDRDDFRKRYNELRSTGKLSETKPVLIYHT